jgi:hypothetical protein
MTVKRTIGLGLVMALLAGCQDPGPPKAPGPDSADRAAGPSAPPPSAPAEDAAPKAFAAALGPLGLEKARFARSEATADGIVLHGVAGEAEGIGAVTAERIAAEGPATEGGTWTARKVSASGVAGPAGRLAARIEAEDVRVPGKGAPAYGRLVLSEVDAPLLGAPVRAEEIVRTPRANSIQIEARQAYLGAAGFPGLPESMVEDLARQPADFRIALVRPEDNLMDIQVDRFSSPLGRLSGSLVVGSADLGDPTPMAALSALPLAELFDPRRWPKGVVVRGGSFEGNVTHPGFTDAIKSAGEVRDPALRRILAPLKERLRLGGGDLRLGFSPLKPVPAAEVGRFLSEEPEAVKALDLSVHGLDAPPGR